LLAAGGGLALAGGARRYRRDLDAARARLAAVDRTVIETAFGAVEYAERGAGEPLLAIQAIFGGCDQGLVSVDGLFPGRRVIAAVGTPLVPQAVLGNPHPLWQPISERDAQHVIEEIQGRGPRLVALSGHDSTRGPTTRSAAPLATATAPCAREKNCGSPPPMR